MHNISAVFSNLAHSLRLPAITFTDLLEILILAFLVYQMLVWIKTTRAWTLLKGIITIVF